MMESLMNRRRVGMKAEKKDRTQELGLTRIVKEDQSISDLDCKNIKANADNS